MTQPASSSLNKLSPGELVDRMTQIAHRLIEIMGEEASVLEACRPMEEVDFHDEKTRHTNDLALLVNLVQKNPHLIDQVPAARVSALKTLMTQLQDRSDQTAKMLLAAKSVSDGIVKELSAFASRKRAPQTGYGRTGSLQAAPKDSSLSLSLDARF